MNDHKPKLSIIIGLPGAGKTTLAKKLAEESRSIRLCPDEWMENMDISLWDSETRTKLEKCLWELGKESLKLGLGVIVEFGSWAKSERNELLKGGREAGATVDLYCLDPPLEELKKRLANRSMEGDDIISNKLDEYSRKFESPDVSERKQYDNFYKIS